MGIALAAVTLVTAGCGPNFRQLRIDGQRAYDSRRFAAADSAFHEAYRIWPEDPENLYDLGRVRVVYARAAMDRGNQPAAMRELDRAVAYFSRAIEAHPGMDAAVVAKNQALELKGQYDDALDNADWAATFVGPMARTQLIKADEMEERGDLDGALLCYRKAVAMEPRNARAYAAFGEFLRRTGRKDVAIEHFKRAYELNPLEPGVAKALTELGEPLPRTTKPLEAPADGG